MGTLREHTLSLTMAVGLLLVIAGTAYYRRRCLRLLGGAEFAGSHCTPFEFQRVFFAHLRELLITLVPFAFLFLVHLAMGHGRQTLQSNELSLAAAVLCCQLITHLQALGWHRGPTSRVAEQTTASNRSLYSVLLLMAILVPALIKETGAQEAVQAVEVPRIVLFLVAVYLYMRWGVGSSMSQLASSSARAGD